MTVWRRVTAAAAVRIVPEQRYRRESTASPQPTASPWSALSRHAMLGLWSTVGPQWALASVSAFSAVDGYC
jgi:hypothetical protein